MRGTAATLGAVLLAAGASMRMGRPKPLLEWQGMALVRWQVERLLAGGCSPVVVVTGHDPGQVESALHGSSVVMAHNPAWTEGRASSVVVGAAALGSTPGGVVLANVDQPLTDRALGALIVAWREAPDCIARPVYEGRHGHPVIFPEDLRDELARVIEAEEGPRAIVHRHAVRVLNVVTPYAEVLDDLNVPEAYSAARQAAPTDETRDNGDSAGP